MTNKLFLLLLACSTTPAMKGHVGDACSNDASCVEGLFCQTHVPGNACTQRCPDFMCPEGARCIDVVVDVVNVRDYLCLAECDGDCRAGWSCQQTSRNFSVCVPAG